MAHETKHVVFVELGACKILRELATHQTGDKFMAFLKVFAKHDTIKRSMFMSKIRFDQVLLFENLRDPTATGLGNVEKNTPTF